MIRLQLRSSATMRSRLLRAHAGERLVEQQHARPRGEAHRDLELALFAMRQRAARCAPATRGKSRALERVVRRRGAGRDSSRRASHQCHGCGARACAARRQFSNTVNARKDVGLLIAAARCPARVRSAAASAVTSAPSSIDARRCVGARSPDSRLISVDLPAPFGADHARGARRRADRARRRRRRPGRRSAASGRARAEHRRHQRIGVAPSCARAASAAARRSPTGRPAARQHSRMMTTPIGSCQCLAKLPNSVSWNRLAAARTRTRRGSRRTSVPMPPRITIISTVPDSCQRQSSGLTKPSLHRDR